MDFFFRRHGNPGIMMEVTGIDTERVDSSTSFNCRLSDKVGFVDFSNILLFYVLLPYVVYHSKYVLLEQRLHIHTQLAGTFTNLTKRRVYGRGRATCGYMSDYR